MQPVFLTLPPVIFIIYLKSLAWLIALEIIATPPLQWYRATMSL